MTVDAWPFLIGRNKTLGYQPVVSPQFLSEQRLSLLLAESAGGDESGPRNAIYREIRGTEVGDFSLIFRVIRPKARDYGLGGNEILLDKGSRPITLTEGIVVKGRLGQMRAAAISYDNLLMAHQLVKTAYYDFWQAEDDFAERVSHPFHLRQASTLTHKVKLLEERPLVLSRQSQRKIAIGLVGVSLVLILASVGLFLHYSHPVPQPNPIPPVPTSHYPPFMSLKLFDRLTSTNSAWDITPDCNFSGESYEVGFQTESFKYCTQNGSNFSNFAFQVNMTIQNGDCGGVIFREDDQQDFYIMRVCQDQTYDFGLYLNRQSDPCWEQCNGRNGSASKNPAIHKGLYQQNVVAVVVQDHTFTLYVNYTRIDTFTDNTFSQGSIGLAAVHFRAPTTVVYNNAIVWEQ